MTPHSPASAGSRIPAAVALAAASLTVMAGASFARRRLIRRRDADAPSNSDATSQGGYESLIGHTPLLYLPNLSSLLPNDVKVYVKMESMNPGGTGKDRAARSMIVDAEGRGDLPPPVRRGGGADECRARGENGVGVEVGDDGGHGESSGIDTESTIGTEQLDGLDGHHTPASTPPSHIPPDVHEAIATALSNTQTHGIIVEGTSGSTGISLASISCSRGHAVIVVLPDDQSKQKADFLRRLGCGVVVVQNCSISNPGHYVNVARRVWEWLEVERRYDGYYWEEVARRSDGGAGKGGTNGRHAPKLIRAAFMNQFENLANVQSHYRTTGPEIYSQLDGKVDAFVMSAGTGGTLVGVGGYLKERWWRNQRTNIPQRRSSPPKIVLVDPPGSSLYNKIKHGVAYARQQSEQRLRRHRYDTLAEGIGLDRITANFGLGCESIGWEQHGDTAFRDQIRMQSKNGDPNRPNNHQRIAPSGYQSKIIDDAIAVTDQQAVHMAHFLLRHEGLFVGSSTAMNLVGALTVASTMPRGSNVVTVVCDGGQRHTSRFWNRDFIEEWGLVWPGEATEDAANGENVSILSLLGIASGKK